MYYLSFKGGHHQQKLTKGALFRIAERGIIIAFIRATRIILLESKLRKRVRQRKLFHIDCWPYHYAPSNIYD